ncbi:hypothetical protein RDI58_029167 [Solanum bulbocastanum]|uniref:Uncharacterized protein n=1 Tax=Solanum bulbocastanum TaxID=147425 RepID=A0AAN8SR71_SOLBU
MSFCSSLLEARFPLLMYQELLPRVCRRVLYLMSEKVRTIGLRGPVEKFPNLPSILVRCVGVDITPKNDLKGNNLLDEYDMFILTEIIRVPKNRLWPIDAMMWSMGVSEEDGYEEEADMQQAIEASLRKAHL